MSTTAALAVDWNRVVLNQMLHTLLTLLRRGEEGGQREDRGRTEGGSREDRGRIEGEKRRERERGEKDSVMQPSPPA